MTAVKGPVMHRCDALVWTTPPSAANQRSFGLYFERDITPTRNIALGFVILPPGEEQPKLSSHEETEEIYYVTRGQGEFFLGDIVAPLEPGTCVYVAPGVAHRAKNTGTEELELIWMNSPPPFGRVGGYEDAVDGWVRHDNTKRSSLRNQQPRIRHGEDCA